MVNKSEEQNKQNDQEKKTILTNKYFSIQNIITMVTNRFYSRFMSIQQTA